MDADTMKTPNSITDAVKGLRTGLGETQQQFAYRMKTAISTIARWETVRPPRGKALAQLFRLAAEKDLLELAAIFHHALLNEYGYDLAAVAPLLRERVQKLREMIESMEPKSQAKAVLAEIDDLLVNNIPALIHVGEFRHRIRRIVGYYDPPDVSTRDPYDRSA